MKKKITAVLLGAGARGGVYARYALDHPDEFQIVAIAEPDTAKREAMKKAHKIPEDSVYETWEPLLERPRFADAAHNGSDAYRARGKSAGARLPCAA